MQRAQNSRRSFLVIGMAFCGAAGLSGCGGEEKEITVTKQEDPMAKAKESMDFYKNNMKKKR